MRQVSRVLGFIIGNTALLGLFTYCIDYVYQQEQTFYAIEKTRFVTHIDI